MFARTVTGILLATTMTASSVAAAQLPVQLRTDTQEATEVVFTGFDVLPVDERDALRASVPLQPGRPVAFNDVQETLRRALTALRNRGYAYARVAALEATVAPDRVRLEIRAEPGMQTVFGPIEIGGNIGVADPVIRRQLAYLPGQLFQVAAIEESQRRLLRLGLFNSVDITIVNPATPMFEVPTRVTVEEGDHTQVTYFFGYGSEEGPYGDLGWRHLNVGGRARTVSTRGRWSSLDRGGEGAFVEPYLFKPGLSLTLRGYVWDLNEDPYDALTAGARGDVSYDVGRNVLTASYLHQHEHVQLPSDALVDLASLLQLTSLGFEATGEQEGLLSALQIGATRDATAQSEGVTRGYYAAARLEQAGAWLPGSFDYVNLFGEIRAYRALARVTLAGRVHYGAIDPVGPQSDVPFSKRYFLGGSESLRGWGRLEVGPRTATGVPLGGQSLLMTSGEIRFPVAGQVGGVVFVDAGNIWDRPWQVSRHLHSNAGIGVRYRSPFGLLRLDIGYQFTTVPGLAGERRWRMHFGIGQAF